MPDVAWWELPVRLGGTEQTADEWIQHVYKSMTDKEMALTLSGVLNVPISDEDVRRRRRRWDWKKVARVSAPRGGGQDMTLDGQILSHIGEQPVSLAELARIVDRSEDTVREVCERLRERGYAIVVEDEQVAKSDGRVDMARAVGQIDAKLSDNWLWIAVIADTHFGSIWEQPTALATFLKWAWENGARLTLHVGDVVDGLAMYKGHWLNLYARTFEEQAWLAANRLPELDGMRYICIGGQHDYSWYRKDGRDVLEVAARERGDITWLGYSKGTIVLSVNGRQYRVLLWHPGGGVAYARSYKLQRGGVVEILRDVARQNMAVDAPRLIAVFAGHIHTRVSFSEGGVLMMHTGCFQDETQYLEEKGLMPDLGGYLVGLHFSPQGGVDSVVEQWRGFAPVRDDWRNWPLPEVVTKRPRQVVYLARDERGWGVCDGV